jgi:F-type H+-transporting ATPase subunit delta
VHNEALAARYSAALFELTKEASSSARVVGDLDAFIAALDSDPTVAEFFVSPVVGRAEKVRILEAALQGRADELTFKFVVLLVRKRRESLLRTVAKQMHELVDRDEGRVRADVATPVRLSADELSNLSARLSSVYDKTVIAQPRLAPELLGGIVVQVGDSYVDGSVAGKLEEVRRHLLASADDWGAASPNGKA